MSLDNKLSALGHHFLALRAHIQLSSNGFTTKPFHHSIFDETDTADLSIDAPIKDNRLNFSPENLHFNDLIRNQVYFQLGYMLMTYFSQSSVFQTT